MKTAKNLVLALLACMLACVIVACSSGSDAETDAATNETATEASAEAEADSATEATPEVVEYEFYSVATPEGWHKSETESHLFTTEDLQKSLSVHVFDSPASELLETEASDEDTEVGDDYVAGGKTYRVAYSERWQDAYYIIDWEDGCVEVHATFLPQDESDEAALQTFLGTLQPAENAYEKWQAIE